jgi:hypothetical protein
MCHSLPPVEYFLRNNWADPAIQRKSPRVRNEGLENIITSNRRSTYIRGEVLKTLSLVYVVVSVTQRLWREAN